MANCKFIGELNRLRKSSSDSIDDIETFDNFKKYMHVVRDAEQDLKDILRKVNMGEMKTLILLCGSAGDGKSHLLSYLKNFDQENLLDGYVIYNDATESNAPNKTAKDTLYEVLSEFKDENLNNSGQNIILAINLGVLVDFIDSEYGEQFLALRNYIFDANILSSKINEAEYNAKSHFQHVSFSDYHMFLLEKDGVNPEYIKAIFDKVVCQDDINPFYTSYKMDCAICPLNMKCPVKKNYEYFSNEKVREYIANLLVNVIIQEKEILTTRELLNYIHDIIVPQAFNFSIFHKNFVSISSYLKHFLDYILPSILFDSIDVTAIMNKTRKYDPLLERDESTDDLVIEYYVADDVTGIINELFIDSPYTDVIKNEKTIEIINKDKTLKTKLFNVLVRLNSISSGSASKTIFQKYVNDLYNYNAGKVPKLNNLYSDVEEAVINWCGNETEGNVCINSQHKAFSLYENIEFDAYLDDIPTELNKDSLKNFLPYIIVEYQNKNGQPIRLDVDYSLYELINKLKSGYVQTAEDRNNHADFIGFINKILKTGSAEKYVTIISENGQKAILEKTKFGVYKFKVVK